jgi:hypothetical protein
LLELCNGFIRGGSDRSQYDEEVAAEEVHWLVLKKYNDLVYCVQLSQDGLIKVLNHDKLKPYLGPHYPKWMVCFAGVV